MSDKTPKEVAAVMSQRARSSRIAGQTSPGPKLTKKANEPKSPTFTIKESTAPPSTADNANTTSAVEQNAQSPAREEENASLPSKSKKDAVEDKTDDGNESTPPRARAVKGVVM